MAWKQFEQLVQAIHAELAPEATVTHNERITGKSGALNQCDVIIRAPVGQYQFFCVVECKDWKDKVGIEVVRAFKAKLEDVGAMKGAIVSAFGFTSEAQKFAESAGIEAYRAVDTQSLKWKEAPLVPIQVVRIELTGATLSMFDDRGGKIDVPATWDSPAFLHRVGSGYLSIRDFMESEWDRIFDRHLPEPEEVFDTKLGEYEVRLSDGRYLPVRLEYSFKPDITYYHGSIGLEHCRGLVDLKTNKLHPTAYKSQHFDLMNVLATWPSTKRKEDVPTATMHTFFMGRFFNKATVPMRYLSIEHIGQTIRASGTS